jgi:multidrug efflux pump subunit AcrB
MLTVPLGFIGVSLILFATNTSLNIQSLMGTIFLIGISVNNGVLLVEFANKMRDNGLSAYESITSAARIRFKPILMTFLATVLALLPMAIGFGQGNEASIPLARAVVGGMLSSTLLTLFIVPIAYTFFLKDYKPMINIDDELY